MQGLLKALVAIIVALGRLIGRLLPLDNPSGLFFFFPFYHTGGAEKVHAEIVACCADQRPWVFFTKRSRDRRYWPQFSAAGRCFDIGWLLKYSYPFSAGILAGLIERHPTPRLFGCNTLYYYLLLPHLSQRVRATDLLHALGGGAEQFALPVLERLTERVVIASAVRQQLLAWYRNHGVAPLLEERISVVPNRVELPKQPPVKSLDGPLRVLFVGRGGVEKRVHLLGEAARRCHAEGLDFQFTLVGELEGCLNPADRALVELTGPLSDEASLTALYRQAHLILIVSSREGFPLTVMEGMAQGCVPVCTAVGGIPDHVAHLENGWLLPAEDEEAVVTALCGALERLSRECDLLARLSVAAYRTAGERFGGRSFCERYRRVIVG